MTASTRTILAALAAMGIWSVSMAQEPKAAAEKPVVVPKYGVFETSIAGGAIDKIDNPFRDVTATGEFTSPSGKSFKLEGFYDGGDVWRFRFVPNEEGEWKFAVKVDGNYRGGGGWGLAKEGQFTCKGSAGPGFLRPSKKNPFRLEHADGTPFYPIGIQTCSFLQPDFDGPNESGQWRNTTPAEWCTAFAGAVNLVRTQFAAGTRAGCALALIPERPKPPVRDPAATQAAESQPLPPAPPIDRYDLDLARKIDEAYKLHHAAGIRQILIIFQDMSLWGNGGSAFGGGRDQVNYKSVKAANLPQQEQYVRYIVARWGAYVDIWELFNEDSWAPDDYLAHLAKVVRAADPYRHIITTNYARPQADWCEIVTWHEYMGMPPAGVDAELSKTIGEYKSFGKPVVNTEFGNQGQLSNVDPVKWRIAVWTAFMNESSLLFWGMSGSKVAAGRKGATGNANAYIGPESRGYFRVLNEFNKDLPIDMRPAAIGYHEHTDIRTYALSNGKVTAVYVHHFADHAKPFQLSYKLMIKTGPGSFRVKWIDPATGKQTAAEEAATKEQYLQLKPPPVTIDAACRIERVE